MLLRFAGARASTRHAGRQLSCSDGDKSQRYAEARDPPHITRCALPAQPCHPDKNSQYGIPAPTSWVSRLLPASDSLAPSETLGLTPDAFGPHARCITPLRLTARRPNPTLGHLASVKESERPRTKPLGDLRPELRRGSPATQVTNKKIPDSFNSVKPNFHIANVGHRELVMSWFSSRHRRAGGTYKLFPVSLKIAPCFFPASPQNFPDRCTREFVP